MISMTPSALYFYGFILGKWFDTIIMMNCVNNSNYFGGSD
jgi:hypothetical protein